MMHSIRLLLFSLAIVCGLVVPSWSDSASMYYPKNGQVQPK